MAAGVEARPPLLDHELLELAATIPSRFKVRGGETKWIFKQTCLKLLRARHRDRKKHGFDVPVGAWLSGPLQNRFRDTVLNPNGAGRHDDRPERSGPAVRAARSRRRRAGSGAVVAAHSGRLGRTLPQPALTAEHTLLQLTGKNPPDRTPASRREEHARRQAK